MLKSDSSQPEFVRPVWSYLDGALNDARINKGREQLNVQRALLGGVSRDYGVPPETIVAIWAMESNFGGNIGSYNVVEALADPGMARPPRGLRPRTASRRPQDHRPGRRGAPTA